MFSQASVKNSVHSGGRVVCLRVGGVSGSGSMDCLPLSLSLGGVHPLGRHPSQRQTPPKTATAVDGMHPTGMHPFVGPQITLFWTSGDASAGSQSQNRQPYLHLAEA